MAAEKPAWQQPSRMAKAAGYLQLGDIVGRLAWRGEKSSASGGENGLGISPASESSRRRKEWREVLLWPDVKADLGSDIFGVILMRLTVIDDILTEVYGDSSRRR